MADQTTKPPTPELILSSDPFAEANPYEILGLDRNTDRAKIKSAYRALQKKAKRGGELWMKAQVANESLTRARKRLAIDLFVVYEARRHEEIVRRFSEVSFDVVPKDPTALLMQVSDLEWGDPTADFEVPAVPKVIFEDMLPLPPRDDELVIPDRRK